MIQKFVLIIYLLVHSVNCGYQQSVYGQKHGPELQTPTQYSSSTGYRPSSLDASSQYSDNNNGNFFQSASSSQPFNSKNSENSFPSGSSSQPNSENLNYENSFQNTGSSQRNTERNSYQRTSTQSYHSDNSEYGNSFQTTGSSQRNPDRNSFQRTSTQPPSRNSQSSTRYPSSAQNRIGEPEFAWRQIDFQEQEGLRYPGGQRQQLSVHDDYIRYNNMPMGVTRWRNRVFVTMPRRRTGIPATLNYVEYSDENSGTKNDVPVIPYPDLRTNNLQTGQNGFRLVSVYRVRVDECKRLWMVDTGLLEYPNNQTRVQPPAIVVFDLKTGQLVHRYELSSDMYIDNSTLACITVDIPDPTKCDEVYGYIPDLSSFAVIVYDAKYDN